MSSGFMIFLAIILNASLLAFVGTCVSITKYQDRYEVKGEEDADALHEASKFRRLEQFDAVMV